MQRVAKVVLGKIRILGQNVQMYWEFKTDFFEKKYKYIFFSIEKHSDAISNRFFVEFF